MGIAIVQLAVENHPQDSRVKINEDGVVQTLSGQMGTGGGNVPLILENKQLMFTPPLAALLCQSAAMYALPLWRGTISSHT